MIWRLVRRQLRSRQRSGFVALITLTSVGGLGLGVAALVVVTSVMNGFDAELRHRILGMTPHLVALGRSLPAAMAIPGTTGHAPFAEAEGMLSGAGQTHPVAVLGISPADEHRVSILPDHITSGSLADLGDDGLIIGAPLARSLGLLPGDPVTLVLPSRKAQGRLVPTFLALRIVGEFEVDAEVDYGVVVVSVEALRGNDLAGQAGTRLALIDPLDSRRTEAALRERFPDVQLVHWRSRYGELFAAVSMERTIMFVLLSFVTALAAFNIVSSLVMAVDERRGEIAILRTMGMTGMRIRAVFLLQGLVTACVGMVLGMAAGLLLTWNINAVMVVVDTLLGQSLIAGSYFDAIPVRVRGTDLLGIGFLTLALSLAGAWTAARRCDRQQPVAGLHDR